MSTIKLVWKAFLGFINPFGSMFDSITGYALGVLNKAVQALDPTNKAKIQATLNIAKKVLALLKACTWLCPTKWQTAYGETIEAVETVVAALEDLNLTKDECEKIIKEVKEAIESWHGPDDETCIAA